MSVKVPVPMKRVADYNVKVQVNAMQQTRLDAAAAANAQDAALWRWFSALLEERRIRWRYAFDSWVVSVDRARVASESTFDGAIRAAKVEADLRGIGQPGERAGWERRRTKLTERFSEQVRHP